MNLTAAIRTAQNALHTTSALTALGSRNIAGAVDPGYSRKIGVLSQSGYGSLTLAVRRAADTALYTTMISATSLASGQQALLGGLNAIERTVGDPENDRSPAALLGALNDALQLYSAAPSDLSLARNAVVKANELAQALNQATGIVQDVRRQADADIATSVDTLNGLLRDLKGVNDAVVNGTHAGADVTDQLDARDKIISKISELMGVHVVIRDGNDAVVYTDSGATLFEGVPRKVEFVRTPGLAAGLEGQAVFVDGVPVTGLSATMPLKAGAIRGLTSLRDDAAVTYQNQLDEIARGLIEVFAESDQSVPATLPDRPGLFTYPGAPAMPGGGLVAGLAGVIAISANVDPAKGGNLALLRDGGISDPGNPAYTYNTTGALSFSERLNELLGKIADPRSFDPAAANGSEISLLRFSSNSVGWLESARQTTTNAADYSATLVSRASDALGNATGVNLDEEMSLLLDLEKSYQASSKLLTIVDEMLAGFIAGIR